MEPVTILSSLIDKPLPKQYPSPAGKNLEGIIKKVEKGYVAIEFIVKNEMLNPGKILHGGFMATFLDEAIGLSVYTLNKPQFYATVDLNINYLGKVKEGNTLFVEGKVIKEGSKIVFAEGSAYLGDRLVAKAASNLVGTDLTR